MSSNRLYMHLAPQSLVNPNTVVLANPVPAPNYINSPLIVNLSMPIT